MDGKAGKFLGFDTLFVPNRKQGGLHYEEQSDGKRLYTCYAICPGAVHMAEGLGDNRVLNSGGILKVDNIPHQGRIPWTLPASPVIIGMREGTRPFVFIVFHRKSFTSFNGQLYGNTLINDWKYITSDDVDTLSSADYFKEVHQLLNVGDLIHVYYVSKDENGDATSFITDTGMFIVRMIDPVSGHVSVLPKHDLNGQGVLANSNVGGSTTISMSADHTVTESYCILSGGVDSDGDSAKITVKNGEVELFSTTINHAVADGSVIKMTKSSTAAADSFSASSFDVSTDGGAARAHGTITVVLNATQG